VGAGDEALDTSGVVAGLLPLDERSQYLMNGDTGAGLL